MGADEAGSAGAGATTHLLYLHGFRSSPLSFKAQILARWLARQRPQVQWWCPQLPPSPREAMALVEAGTAAWPGSSMAVVGSSLGGYYAAWVAERRACPAVLINPAVQPARDLARHIGELTQWHDPAERFFFRAEFVDELRALQSGPFRPDGTRAQARLAIIAKGDELLDWREMAERCAGAQLCLLEGSDHALSDFDDHLPRLLRFLGLVDPEAGAGEAG